MILLIDIKTKEDNVLLVHLHDLINRYKNERGQYICTADYFSQPKMENVTTSRSVVVIGCFEQ